MVAGNEVDAARRPHRGHTEVPAAARWLGAFGALPFVVLALSVPVLEGLPREQAAFALAAYGAVILSFLGGVHWGLATAGAGPRQAPAGLSRRLGFSVVPSLLGWTALLLPRPLDLVVLAAAFALLLLFDVLASRRGEAPPWYPTLRWPLTAVVVASLVVAASL